MSLIIEPCSGNRAVVYRDSLSSGSYGAVRHSLETVAGILAGGAADPWTFPWEEVRYQHVARVRRELIESFAPATVNKMLSALRQVFKHAWRLGHLDHETYARVSDVENVKASSRKRGRAVEIHELEALFAVCSKDPSPAGRRDAAMLAVLYGGGLRRSELCALDLADFDTASGGLTVRNGKGEAGPDDPPQPGDVQVPHALGRGAYGGAGAAVLSGRHRWGGAAEPVVRRERVVHRRPAAAGGGSRGREPARPAQVVCDRPARSGRGPLHRPEARRPRAGGHDGALRPARRAGRAPGD